MERLLKISLVISLLGILFLSYLSLIAQPKETKISNLTEKDINKNVKIAGELISLRDYSGFSILTIKQQNDTIEGIIDSNNFYLNLSTNYTFFGKLSEYNRTLQINIERIENDY